MKRILVLIMLLLALVVTSCAPRIYGAKPHSRDRNCGCELRQTVDDRSCTETLTFL